MASEGTPPEDFWDEEVINWPARPGYTHYGDGLYLENKGAWVQIGQPIIQRSTAKIYFIWVGVILPEGLRRTGDGKKFIEGRVGLALHFNDAEVELALKDISKDTGLTKKVPGFHGIRNNVDGDYYVQPNDPSYLFEATSPRKLISRIDPGTCFPIKVV